MEMLDVIDYQLNVIDVQPKEIVHEKGLLHQVIHFVIINNVNQSILFQKRSSQKKFLPNYYDVTVGGHLTTKETKDDFFREVKEEIGIDVNKNMVDYFGYFFHYNEYKEIKNFEIIHLYYHFNDFSILDYELQKSELDGLIEISIKDFKDLVYKTKDNIKTLNRVDNQKNLLENIDISLKDFIPDGTIYYKNIVNYLINQKVIT